MQHGIRAIKVEILENGTEIIAMLLTGITMATRLCKEMSPRFAIAKIIKMSTNLPNP